MLPVKKQPLPDFKEPSVEANLRQERAIALSGSVTSAGVPAKKGVFCLSKLSMEPLLSRGSLLVENTCSQFLKFPLDRSVYLQEVPDVRRR